VNTQNRPHAGEVIQSPAFVTVHSIEQVVAPQSEQSPTAALPHSVPTSLSLDTYSIRQDEFITVAQADLVVRFDTFCRIETTSLPCQF
jgi:hypothetical protein